MIRVCVVSSGGEWVGTDGCVSVTCAGLGQTVYDAY